MRISVRQTIAFVIGASAGAFALSIASCSSSSTGGVTGGPDGGTTTPAACTSPNALTIVFSPMYSAFDGTHTFEIPAIVNGIAAADVKWSASDPSMVGLQADSDTGGVMITVLKSGSVTITAEAGGLCGSSLLTITSAQASDWQTGNARYNDGVALHFGPGRGDGGGMAADGGGGPACTNCHGPTATNGAFNDISHTPEQTGGFSDQDLIGIITQGNIPGWTVDGGAGPEAGYFDDSIISYRQWHRLHQWTDITQDEQLGIIVYLRSLTPAAQNGSANFGGRFDGGRPPRDGGGFPHDGGGPPPPSDSGSAMDAGTE